MIVDKVGSNVYFWDNGMMMIMKLFNCHQLLYDRRTTASARKSNINTAFREKNTTVRIDLLLDHFISLIMAMKKDFRSKRKAIICKSNKTSIKSNLELSCVYAKVFLTA
jgi:hypothetical protein